MATSRSHLIMPCLATIVTLFAGLFTLGAGFMDQDYGVKTEEDARQAHQALVLSRVFQISAAALWGIVVTRSLLGHGKEQKESLKNAANNLVHAHLKATSELENTDFLVRPSSADRARIEELVRPISDNSVSESQELLRVSSSGVGGSNTANHLSNSSSEL